MQGTTVRRPGHPGMLLTRPAWWVKHCLITTNGYTALEYRSGADLVVPGLGDPQGPVVTIDDLRRLVRDGGKGWARGLAAIEVGRVALGCGYPFNVETTMRIFLDTADVEAVRKALATGLVDGVTTNPSHIAKTGRSFLEVVHGFCELGLEHVSVEAMGESTEELVEDAERVAATASCVVVKIPMTPEGMAAVPILEKEKKVQTNVTMVFSPAQASLAMKAGASYVSIVLSRLENFGHESETLIEDCIAIQHSYGFSSRIIAASIKTQPTLMACLRSGVDVVTVPVDVFWQMFRHPLTDAGLEQFQADWLKVPRGGQRPARGDEHRPGQRGDG